MTSTPRLYDISRTISPALAVWPGDQPFTFEHVYRTREGHAVNLTTLTFSPHTGSHADAPYHIADNGAHPADLPLDAYIGPARVVTVTRRSGGIVPEDLAGVDLAGVPRLLIHTWVSEVPDGTWPEGFPYPTVALIDWWADQGGVLLGMDSPSMDDETSHALPGHHRLRERGMVHLETLCLAGVPDGVYELIALPLKMTDVCGSPVRAILRAGK